MTERREPTAEDRLGYLAETLSMIDKHGVAIQAVFGTGEDPTLPFAYTVGLTMHGHPELLVIGLPHDVAHVILNRLAATVRIDGHTYNNGDLETDVLSGDVPLRIRGPVDDQQYPVNTASALYGEGVRVLQVEWPDSDFRFAEDPRHNPKGTSPALPMKEQ